MKFSFEKGDLSGWNAAGDAAVITMLMQTSIVCVWARALQRCPEA